MNFLVLGINYAPETTGIAPYNTGLCEYLVQRGHSVHMVTTFPYYPEWSKRPGDRGILFRNDHHRGVPVYRCWHYVPYPVGRGKRILHELTFGFTGFLRALILPKPDLIVVVSPPLILTAAAWLLSLLKGCPYIVHVQDLPLDGVLALKLMNPGWRMRCLKAVESFVYRRAAFVSGISPGMVAALRSKGVTRERCVLFPNWVHSDMRLPLEPASREALLRRLGLPSDAFLAVYSGNLGIKQGLEVLVEAAGLLARRTNPKPKIHIVIVGSGASRTFLESKIRETSPGAITLLHLLPAADYAGLLAAANVSIITQIAGAGNFCFPSKLLSITASRRAVVAVTDGQSELALAVRGGGFGLIVPPAKPDALADCLIDLALNPDKVAELAAKGTWVEQFSPELILPRLERQLILAAGGKEAAPSQ